MRDSVAYICVRTLAGKLASILGRGTRGNDITADNRERSCHWTQTLGIAANIPRPPHSSTKSGERLLRPGDRWWWFAPCNDAQLGGALHVAGSAPLGLLPRAYSRVNVNAKCYERIYYIRMYVHSCVFTYLRGLPSFFLSVFLSRIFPVLHREDSDGAAWTLGFEYLWSRAPVAPGTPCINPCRASRRSQSCTYSHLSWFMVRLTV